MENGAAIGWIAAIIIGGLAGWLAEQFMKSNMGMLMNIVLGSVRARAHSTRPARARCKSWWARSAIDR